MQKRGVWATGIFMLGVLAGAVPLRAQGGDMAKAPEYIYVSEWAVPRAQWGDMAKLNEGDRTLEEKLLNDGTITAYGEFENLIHTEGQPTHGSWFTANNREGILKALQSFMSRRDTTAPVLAASKHWDHFLTSSMHNSRPGIYENTYLSDSMWELKPGQYEAFNNLVKARVVPVMEKLLSDGVVVTYGLAYQTYATDMPDMIEFYSIVSDTSGLDKVSKAFEGVFGKDPEIGPAMGSLVKEGSHRGTLLRITHLKIK
jgi:hypothetical protein